MEKRRRHAGYVCRGKLCRSCHHRQKSLLTAWWTSHRRLPLTIHIVTHLKSKKMRESDHLILITSGKIWAKATPQLARINERRQCCEYCKSPRLCALPSDKAHGATKNISDNASAVSRDCRSKALATAPHLANAAMQPTSPTPPHPSARKSRHAHSKRANAHGGWKKGLPEREGLRRESRIRTQYLLTNSNC